MASEIRRGAFLEINPSLSLKRCDELEAVLTECEQKISHISRMPFFKAAHEFRSVTQLPPFSFRKLSSDNRITIFKGKAFGRLDEGGQRKIDHAMNLATQERYAHARMVLEQNYSTQDYQREVFILGTLLKDTPNTIKLVDHYEYVGRKDFRPKVAMITPYYPQKDLFYRKDSPYNIKDVLRWAKQILACLKEAHAKNVTHNDLKLDNFFVNGDDDVVVADWGCARITGQNLVEIDERNEFLIPPEILRKKNIRMADRYTPAGDIWAIGIVLYELIYKTNPDFIQELISEDQKVGYLERFYEKLEAYQSQIFIKPLEDMIQKALSPDPTNRPTAEELLNLVESELAKLS